MRYLPLSLFLFFASSCTHEVHDLHVATDLVSTIRSELAHECESSVCALDKCWREKESFVVCDIAFSFRTPDFKAELMDKIIEKLANRGLSVGFCGRDSSATTTASVVVQGFVVGFVGAALGGNASGASHVSNDTYSGPVDLIQHACESAPIQKKELVVVP